MENIPKNNFPKININKKIKQIPITWNITIDSLPILWMFYLILYVWDVTELTCLNQLYEDVLYLIL